MTGMATVLDDRKLRILLAVIDDYVHTAMPVGSRTISRKYETALSSATIRNEMSDLEEMGYLEQPHVSAGRVPSIRAYRLYVDRMIASMSFMGDVAPIEAYLQERFSRMQDLVESAAAALSELTRYAAVVMMPKQLDLRITCLQLVAMTPGSALLVIITDGGVIRNSVIHVSESLNADDLYGISRVLSERLRGHTLQEVQEMLATYSRYSGANENVCRDISEMASQMARQTSEDTVAVHGTHNILSYPEFTDVKKARGFMSALETRETLLGFFPVEPIRPFTVRIGPEIGVEALEDCAVVCAGYAAGGGHRGTIGVIGPARMPYANVLRVLYTVGNTLSALMGEM